MIKIIPAAQRHFSDLGWLKTYWLFSFATYYDPENIQFGALRVFNDDVVAPGTGFPTHPHQEMEIVTVVLDGEMTHEDSMGNKTVIRAGDVQRMSAGTGLTHSEFNLADRPVHFYQIWIFPDVKGLTPGYDQKHYEPAAWKNQLCPIASGQGKVGSVTFHTDATIYRGQFEKGSTFDFETSESRRVFLYLTNGAAQANGQHLKTADQARIDLEPAVTLRALSDTQLMLIDVPSCKGWGYSEQTLRGARQQ
jgi:redox-sensitive bicupin YhaK (pirin superfamily)